MVAEAHSAGEPSISWEVQEGDCLDLMLRLPGGSVDACVCSPPYADQRNYEAAAKGEFLTYAMTRSASRRQRSAAPMQFAKSFDPVLEQMLRVLTPTGSLMLNLGVIIRDGEESPYADEVLYRARKMGWKLLHRMVWNKPNGIPLSDPRYLHITHEWVFWLAKSTDAYRGYDKDTRIPHSETSIRRAAQPYMTRKDQRYQKRGKAHKLHPDGSRPRTVFSAGVGQESIDHPAIMALAVALRLVSLSCPPGGLVLDPYCGSGTTGVAALRRGRSFLGMELQPEYVQLARERIREGGLEPPPAPPGAMQLFDDAPLINQSAEVLDDANS